MQETTMDDRKKQMAEQQARISSNLNKIKRKIVVMSGKGGVGKTTVAVNLACGLAAAGKKVGLMDVDIHGPNVPKMLGLEGQHFLADDAGIIPLNKDGLKVVSMAFALPDSDSPVIWRGPMKMQLISQFLGDVKWGELDYLIIDLPPGTGDESLSIAQQISGSEAIIVTTPQDVALLDSRKSVNFARQLNMPILGIIENMSGMKCPHCGKTIDLFKSGGGQKSAEEMNIPFLGSIPVDPEIVVTGDSGKPVVLEAVDSDTDRSFKEIISIIENKGS